MTARLNQDELVSVPRKTTYLVSLIIIAVGVGIFDFFVYDHFKQIATDSHMYIFDKKIDFIKSSSDRGISKEEYIAEVESFKSLIEAYDSLNNIALQFLLITFAFNFLLFLATIFLIRQAYTSDKQSKTKRILHRSKENG